MPSLILPSERKLIKPSGRYVLNRASRQAIGLVAWYPFTPAARLIDHAGFGAYDLDPAGSPAFAVDQGWADVGDILTSSSQRWNAVKTPITGPPCTLVAWHNPDNSTDVGWLVEVYSSTDTARYMVLMKRATGEMRARQQGATTTATADATSAYTVGAWNLTAAIFTSDSDTAVKANGASRVSSSTASGSKTLDGLAVGAEMFSTPRNYYGGLVGDVRVYNRALSDAELNELYEPNTRLELYYEIGKRAVFLISSGAGQTTVNPAAANAQATAPTPTVRIIASPAAGLASATAPALTATVLVQASVSIATATVPAAVPSVVAVPAASAASAVSPTATTSPSGDQTTVQPAAAAATATSPTPSILVQVPLAATIATATAPQVTVAVLTVPAAAIAAATAPGPTGRIVAIPGAATGGAVVPSATTDPAGGQETATPAAAPASCVAPQATIRIIALPASAAGSCVANDPTPALVVVTGTATAQATAPQATPAILALPGPAAGTATANNATTPIRATPLSAIAASAANSPTTIPSPFVFVEGVEDAWTIPEQENTWSVPRNARSWTFED